MDAAGGAGDKAESVTGNKVVLLSAGDQQVMLLEEKTVLQEPGIRSKPQGGKDRSWQKEPGISVKIAAGGAGGQTSGHWRKRRCCRGLGDKTATELGEDNYGGEPVISGAAGGAGIKQSDHTGGKRQVQELGIRQPLVREEQGWCRGAGDKGWVEELECKVGEILVEGAGGAGARGTGSAAGGAGGAERRGSHRWKSGAAGEEAGEQLEREKDGAIRAEDKVGEVSGGRMETSEINK
ncbi:hypothetical protein NPIL_62541 [Nephila pilipes]|uniref:Uncharacterized protein n=1 Tax=Nephila pilipes TaxID=299642 RepID=A0A8X6T5K6_NEPPI|nr:hypothetical protein NPIL_62541 [Nephila pilipes]